VLGDPDEPDDDASAPFVGRDRELAALRSVADIAMGGHLALALVSGEPGIGKTALVEQFAGEARKLGATVHWGRGWEGDDAPPLWMWSQLLRSSSEVVSPADLGDELGGGVADVVRSLLDTEGAAESQDNDRRDDAQLNQFDALSEILAAMSRRSALVLVLDDLHWADPASLALLRFISQDRRPCRILIVATYRDTEPERPQLRETVAALARARHIVHLPLEGLEVDEAARVVHAHLGRAADEDAVVALHHGTNGNPFFITQIVRLQREQGFDAPASDMVLLPPTLAEVITRRLAMLPPGCIEVLEVAAVIGRDVRLEQLSALPRLGDVPLVPLLDTLERFRILTPTSGVASWTFTHDVLRSTVLAGIGAARRAALHLEIAEAFVALRAQGVPVDVEALALHFARCGTAAGRSEGASYAHEAATRAAGLFAHEDAARQYALALELSDDRVPTDERLALRLAEANERFLAGDHDGGRTAALDAAHLARQSDEPSALASVAFVFSRAGSRWVADPAAIAVVEEAIAALPDADTPMKVSLEARLAVEYFYSEPERARALSEDALRRARAHGDDHALVDALTARRFAIWGPDDVEELLEVGAEIIQLARRVERPEMASQGHFARRAAFHELGDLAGMEREMQSLELLAQQQRLPVDHAVVAMFYAMKAATEGRYSEAGDALDRAARIADRANDLQLSVAVVPLQIWLAREQRRFDEAFRLLEAARAYQPDSLMVEAATLTTSSLAGEVVPRERLHRLVAGLGEPHTDWLWLSAVAEASVCAHRSDDAASAAILAGYLEPYAASGRNVTSGPTLGLGAAAYYAGICAMTSGDLDRAIVSLDAAVRDNERMGARAWVLRSLTASAVALGARGSAGDRKQRTDRVEQASALAEQVEPCLAVDEFHALSADAMSDESLPAGLTEREAQVLRLAAQGLTNDSVARSLNVSVKTVERHLGNVYTKLGVRNRAEATAWAVREGLA
jgi:ATP/maltotriose-dependent transcriptional regulator MalT